MGPRDGTIFFFFSGPRTSNLLAVIIGSQYLIIGGGSSGIRLLSEAWKDCFRVAIHSTKLTLNEDGFRVRNGRARHGGRRHLQRVPWKGTAEFFEENRVNSSFSEKLIFGRNGKINCCKRKMTLTKELRLGYASTNRAKRRSILDKKMYYSPKDMV